MAEANPNTLSAQNKGGDRAAETPYLDIFDNLQNSLDALDTFIQLIDTAAHYEPTMFGSCNGLADLCTPHLNSLTTNIDTLRFDMARAKRMTADAAAVLKAAAQPHPISSPRQRQVAERANPEPDFVQIARDTNVEEATVRRVVDRLLADTRTPTPPEPSAKAVNN